MANHKSNSKKPKGEEVAQPLFAVTYQSENPKYLKYYGHASIPADVRKGERVEAVRAELENTIPADVKIKSILAITKGE